MRIVIALDKFKGTLTSSEACLALASGISKNHPKFNVDLKPMADGGEGTAPIISKALQMEKLFCETVNLFGHPIKAPIYWHNSRKIALIESADVLGIKYVDCPQEDLLMKASSVGLGHLLKQALLLKPHEVWIAIGSTMSADTGFGVLEAFGAEAFDSQGQKLKANLESMAKVAALHPPLLVPYASRVKIRALCDVSASVSGQGVTLSHFLQQKGAQESSIPVIGASIEHFWNAARKNYTMQSDVTFSTPFTGAGGGICLALAALFPHLSMEHGAYCVSKALALEASLQSASYLICGEGCLDEQTLSGKAVSVVSQISKNKNLKLWGVFGTIKGNKESLFHSLNLEKNWTILKEGQVQKNLIEFSKKRLYEIGCEIAAEISQASQT